MFAHSFFNPEEGMSAADMIARLRLIGDSKAGLFQLDREAARRAEKA